MSPRFSHDENLRLILAYQDGDRRAGDDLCKANAGMVAKIAGHYAPHCQSLEFADLEQEGRLGLLHAASKFDVERGLRFSTYATHWIRQSIVRAMENTDQFVRVSVHRGARHRRLIAARDELEIRLGREASVEQLAAEEGLPIKDVEDLLGLPGRILSLDYIVSDDGHETALGELIADPRARDFEEACLTRCMLASALDAAPLTSLERFVLEGRVGWDGGGQETLKEIASTIGMSTEGVRHVENRAVTKLRAAVGRELLVESWGP